MRTLAVACACVSIVLIGGCETNRDSRQPEHSETERQPAHQASREQAAVRPATQKATPDAEAARIKSLIAELAEIEDPDIGFAPTMSGEVFSPVPSSQQMSSGILMNHGLKRSPALVALVRYGDRALPHLLESLDDATPTRASVDHSGGFGGMWYGQRPSIRWAAADAEQIQSLVEEGVADDKITKAIPVPAEFFAQVRTKTLPFFLPQPHREFNRENGIEREVLANARTEFLQLADQVVAPFGFESEINNHNVTIGDVCYVIIGQITNRTYQAAQYQPTACIYIHSPTHDGELAEEVRAVWTSEDPRKTLFESLVLDLQSADRWGAYHTGAAMRLAYYFPEESESIFLERLSKIPFERWRHDGDGARMDAQLIDSIGCTGVESVRAKLFDIMNRTPDPALFLATLAAFEKEHGELISQRCRHFLSSLPEEPTEESHYVWSDHGESILRKFHDRFPKDAWSVFRQVVNEGGVHRRSAVCNVLYEEDRSLVTPLLGPLLDDKRDIPCPYMIKRRVCDEAAHTIAYGRDELSFNIETSNARRDEQIVALKAALGLGADK